MYAVIETGGKQVRVKEGETVRVERLAAEPGADVTLDRVLLIGNGKTEVGTPLVTGALVRATVVRQGRRRKVRIMKYKAKAHYRRRQGHRQAFTELRIEKIEFGEAEKSETPAPGTVARTPAGPRKRKVAREEEAGGA